MSLLAIVLFGAGAVASGFPRRAGSAGERAFRAALAAALGIGAWSSAYAAGRMAGAGAGAAKDWVLALSGLALIVGFRRREREDPRAGEPAPPWLIGLFALSCLVAVAAFLEHTVRFPDGGWDAWMIWNLRARFLARSADLRSAFSPDLSFLAHPDYPWLLPGAVAQGYALFGESRAVPAALGAIYGLLAVAVVALGLWRSLDARWGLLGGLAVTTLPCFAVFASNQQSDVPLAVYLAAATALLASARSRREIALAGFAAGLGMWTKNEGALYAGCLLLALLWRRRDLPGAGAFALGALPGAALFAWFKLALAPPNDLVAFSTGATVLHNALDLGRWGHLLLLALRRIVYFQDFALWAVALALALILFFRGRPPAAERTALLLAFAAYGPIYLLQPHGLEWIFRTSADRILIQLWPAAVLATLPSLAQTKAST